MESESEKEGAGVALLARPEGVVRAEWTGALPSPPTDSFQLSVCISASKHTHTVPPWFSGSLLRTCFPATVPPDGPGFSPRWVTPLLSPCAELSRAVNCDGFSLLPNGPFSLGWFSVH